MRVLWLKVAEAKNCIGDWLAGMPLIMQNKANLRVLGPQNGGCDEKQSQTKPTLGAGYGCVVANLRMSEPGDRGFEHDERDCGIIAG